MKTYQFKKLEILEEKSTFQKWLKSDQLKKTLLYSLAGMAIGYVLFYFSDSRSNDVFWNSLAKEYVLMGFAIGIFITNSPCARGKC